MATNIKARRKLSELFAKGVEVRFGPDPETGESKGRIGPFKDDDGFSIPLREEEVAMWITPANPLQRDMAMREAQAKRARALVHAKRDPESEEHLTIMAFIANMSDETLVDYLLASADAERQAEAEREILRLDEWKDMTSYQEAARQFQEKTQEELENDPEWDAFIELDNKLGDQIAKRERQLRDAQGEAFRMLSRETLERQALDKRAELVGTQAFITEYERWMTYYAVRDPDQREKPFYDHADELWSEDDAVRDTILTALMPYIKDGSEAKNSQGAVSGSDSSVPPVKPETSESSTPQAQSA